MADLTLRITSVFQDSVSRGLLNLLNPINLLQAGLLGLGIAFAGVGLAAGIIGYVSTKMAADFQQGMTRLKTGAGDVTDNMRVLGQGILAVSTATGVLTNGTEGLLAAMYLVISANQRGAEALNTLRVAAQGAQLEQAKVVDVTRVLTTIQTDFGRTTHTATQYMDGLISAVAHGKITLEELSVAMSPILPFTHELGVHFADVAAALSVMTNAGIPADQGATALRFTMQSLILPTKGSMAAMKEWGLNSTAVAKEMKVSLLGALQMYMDAAKRAGPEGSKPFIDALAQMVGGGQRAAKALFSLTQNMGDWRTQVGLINTAMQSNATDVTGWSDVLGNANIQADRGKAAFAALAIVIGNQLLPYVIAFLGWLTPLTEQFTVWVDKSGIVTTAMNNMITAVQNTGAAIAGVIAWYQAWQPYINNAAIAIAFFFVPALVLAGVRAVISAAQITYSFIVSVILTGTEGWAAAIKLAVFIGSLVASGARASVAAAIITYEFVASLVRAAVQAYLASYAIYGSMIPALYAMGVAAFASLGPFGILIGVLAGLLAIMKQISDQMNLNMTYAIDTMGNHIQRSTGRIIQSVDQMKTSVNADTAQMALASIGSFQTLSTSAIRLMQQMDKTVTDNIGSMSQDAIAHYNLLGQTIDTINNRMDTSVSTHFPHMTATIRHEMDIAKTESQGTMAFLSTSIPASLGTMTTNSTAAVNQMQTSVSQAFNQVRSTAGTTVAQMTSDVNTKFTRAAADAKTQFSNLAANIMIGLTTAKNSVFTISNQMIATLSSAWKTASAQAYTGGVNIGAQLAAGLNSQTGAVTAAAANLASAISSHLPHSPAKVGPLRDLASAGEQIVKQLNAGMLKAQPSFAASLNMLLTPVGGGSHGLGGGGTTIINNYVTVHAPAMSHRDADTLANLINQKLAHRYRIQTTRASTGVY